MANVITAPESVVLDGSLVVFLAGAIDMGSAVDWQSNVIEKLYDEPITLVNPRRPNFTPDTLDAQILWELDAMDKAHIVFMWFPKDAKAPIALLETGLWLPRMKLLIGAEHGFYRRRNLELTCKHHAVPLHEKLKTMMDVVKSSIPLE